MKITIVHRNKNHQLLVSYKNIERFLESILTDDSKYTIGKFRETVPCLVNGYMGYKGMATWKHVLPAAEFGKDEQGNLVMRQNNGVLLLTFANFKEDDLEAAKQKLACLPSTLAVLLGVDGTSLNVLVKYTKADGSLPADEAEAERIYQVAFRYFAPLYSTMVKATLHMDKPSLKSDFLMTQDAAPYYHAEAVALKLPEQVIHGVSTSVENFSQDVEKSDAVVEKNGNKLRDNVLQMINFLRDKYEFRYNTMMLCTEYRALNREWCGYQPVDGRVQKRMTLEVQLQNIRVSIKDVRNYLESDYIESYNPMAAYLLGCYGKWDGQDHIRALARTVPTDNPHWEDWFYTWFLGMVSQWQGYGNRQYGNSVAPLLISRQGYNKSTFCRRLLPDELQWGYTDNLQLAEKRQVLQAMSQQLLVNLDEFNQISPKIQQGFLKNIIQLPNVKMKPPYGSHVKEFPRTASFIATSNMEDILSDPSGNRRFLGIELTGPIDVSVRPNYQQLFAQALAALQAGEKCYFDGEQTKLVMENNMMFEVVEPVEQYFNLYFGLTDDEEVGKYMTAAEIFALLKKKLGSSLELKSLISFGRKLSNISGITRKRFKDGLKYLVVYRGQQIA